MMRNYIEELLKNILLKSAIKKHFMGNSQKTKNNESTWGAPILHF